MKNYACISRKYIPKPANGRLARTRPPASRRLFASRPLARCQGQIIEDDYRYSRSHFGANCGFSQALERSRVSRTIIAVSRRLESVSLSRFTPFYWWRSALLPFEPALSRSTTHNSIKNSRNSDPFHRFRCDTSQNLAKIDAWC